MHYQLHVRSSRTGRYAHFMIDAAMIKSLVDDNESRIMRLWLFRWRTFLGVG